VFAPLTFRIIVRALRKLFDPSTAGVRSPTGSGGGVPLGPPGGESAAAEKNIAEELAARLAGAEVYSILKAHCESWLRRQGSSSQQSPAVSASPARA
jgi:hypothetical protein